MPLDSLRILSSMTRREAQFLHHSRAAATPLGPAQPAQRAHEGNRLGRFHIRVQPAFFGQIADARTHTGRARAAEQAAGAAVGINNAQQHAQRGRFARAIGAEDAVNAATLNRERHIVHGDMVAIIFGEAGRLDNDIGQLLPSPRAIMQRPLTVHVERSRDTARHGARPLGVSMSLDTNGQIWSCT